MADVALNDDVDPSMMILPDIMFSPVPGPADPCTWIVACLFIPPQ
jgi:hypothetical protein